MGKGDNRRCEGEEDGMKEVGRRRVGSSFRGGTGVGVRVRLSLFLLLSLSLP